MTQLENCLIAVHRLFALTGRSRYNQALGSGASGDAVRWVACRFLKNKRADARNDLFEDFVRLNSPGLKRAKSL
jgi:hypothetical protein